MNEELRPKVGLGVMIFKDGKILVGRRNGSKHANGYWCFPGGHLDHGESIESCARRETMEEAGIEIENVRFLAIVNFVDLPPDHYVCIGMMADWKSGEPRPEDGGKMCDWGWYALEDLPQPFHIPNRKFIQAYKDGTKFIDSSSVTTTSTP